VRPRARWHPWGMLGPTLALLVVFFVVPIGVAVVESFFSWDMLTPPRWVGGANYEAIARHGELLGIVLRTLGYSAIVVVGSMSLGLALALLLDRPGRFFAFVRGSVFSAYVVSWVAVALLWMWLLDGNTGIAGRLLRAVGAHSASPLADPHWALVTLAFVATWKLTGYAMIVFLAGLQGVPKSLLEAAALDGAGAWARFRHVTAPLLAPTAAFVATTSLVTSFQAFDVVRIMTQGGPARATELFVYSIYEQIFLDLSVGRASALTVVFFVVLLALATIQLRVWGVRAGAGSGGKGRAAR
jgi:ABC-type sugar transport system permease subunit